MAKKEPTPKVTDEQIQNAQKNLKEETGKKIPPPGAKGTDEKKENVKKTKPPKQSTPKKPAYLKKVVTEFTVGTEDYAAVVAKHNEVYGTMWNTHRVRPAFFYGIFEAVKDYYAKK